MRRSHRLSTRVLLPFVLLALLLSACDRPSKTPFAKAAATPARPVASGTNDSPDDAAAFMRIAFPRWDGRRPWVMAVPGEKPEDGEVTVAISPQAVLAVDGEHRVLVVAGVPSDEHGESNAAHASQGDLGAYWFARRSGRWVLTSRRDAVLWGGVSGDVGRVTAVRLGSGHPAVVLEGGSCWQGFCADWLSLVGFDARGSSLLVRDLRLRSSSLGAVNDCDNSLAGAPPDQTASDAEESPPMGLPVDAENCFDVSGKWRLRPRGGRALADLVVTYTGFDLAADPKTGALKARKIAETLVMRDSGGTYKAVRGENPTHYF